MRVELHAAAKGRDGIALPPTTVAFESGHATLVRAATEQRPTVLGLIASGRMRPDAGRVTIDGRTDPAGMRRRIALVDAPGVSDPAPNVAVAGVVAEELMFAGVAGTRAVARWLDQLGLRHLARLPIGDVDPLDRLRLLTEFAILRDGVEAVVLVAPDRHGGDPVAWWGLARGLAARGFAVLVVAGDASAAAIGADALLERMRGDGDADTDTDASGAPDPSGASAADLLISGGLA